MAATAFFDIFRLGELLAESAAHFNMDADLAWGDVAVNQTPDDPTSLKENKNQSIWSRRGHYLGFHGNASLPSLRHLAL